MSFLKNYSKLKRLFDIFLSSTGLFFLSSLWVISSFAIWLQEGRPIFYLQDRVGLNGKIFKMLKFRTLGYKKADSRLALFLRRSALDELPQLINILKGEMSFVGPRPLVPEEVLGDKSADSRDTVKPGLTGAAQVFIAKDASVFEKSQYDYWYIQNRSFGLDIALILKSFWISLGRRWDTKIKP